MKMIPLVMGIHGAATSVAPDDVEGSR